MITIFTYDVTNLEFCQDFYRQCFGMMFDLFLVLNLVAVLYIWFDSDAVIEWGRLLRLSFLKYKEFDESKKSAMPPKNYTEFLEFKYNKYFLIRLITCPICLAVWCNIFLLWTFWATLPIIILGFNVILTWSLYHMLKWITKKANE